MRGEIIKMHSAIALLLAPRTSTWISPLDDDDDDGLVVRRRRRCWLCALHTYVGGFYSCCLAAQNPLLPAAFFISMQISQSKGNLNSRQILFHLEGFLTGIFHHHRRRTCIWTNVLTHQVFFTRHIIAKAIYWSKWRLASLAATYYLNPKSLVLGDYFLISIFRQFHIVLLIIL